MTTFGRCSRPVRRPASWRFASRGGPAPCPNVFPEQRWWESRLQLGLAPFQFVLEIFTAGTPLFAPLCQVVVVAGHARPRCGSVDGDLKSVVERDARLLPAGPSRHLGGDVPPVDGDQLRVSAVSSATAPGGGQLLFGCRVMDGQDRCSPRSSSFPGGLGQLGPPVPTSVYVTTRTARRRFLHHRGPRS